MQWNQSLLCSAVWLLLLCLAPVSTEKRSKRTHDRHSQIRQRTHSTRKFCDPSFSNQTAGAITQKCSSGFYRERTGPYRGRCVPCSCNGLSNECDERTGNCVNCQFDSTGDRCERCKEGYYGNAAERTCRACPCPSTWNNFALACLDTGSGLVECLCKRGYSGARCERCAFGYYGNPMVYGGSCKPCSCKDGSNICDSLTGECIECITSGDSSCGAHCHECDSCTVSLLLDLERMDDVLAQQKQRLQNVSDGAGSLFGLNDLQANISETKIRVGRYSTAVRHLDPKVEQLEADVDAVGGDLSQLTDKTLEAASALEEVLQNANETKLKAEDLLSEAESLLTAIQDLIKQQTGVKPGASAALSQRDGARMVEEAQRVVREMRERGCGAQRGRAGREQEDARHLLDRIRNMTDPVETNQAVLNQTAGSLMASDSALREVAALLSDTKDRVNRTQSLNLKSGATLQHLENLQSQLEGEQSALLPVTGMTKDLLKNTTDVFLMLEEIKREFEDLAAQFDGAKLELFKKSNNIAQIKTKVDIVSKAEEHAEKLNREAAGFQQMLHNATNSTDLHSVLGAGAHNSIINAIEEAEMAANQSREAANQASKDVKDGGLVNRAEGLKDNSTHLRTEANETQRKLETLSHTVKTLKDSVNTQKEKGESLRTDISTVTDNLNKIKRDDTDVLIKSAKTAASASNSTVSDVTGRLRNLSQDVERISLTNVSVNVDDMLADAEQALKNLSAAFPVLEDKITQVEALSEEASPSANMTESIRRIKDVIEETRNFVDRLSAATIFNGKGHVELRPPRNLDDIKAFTAVDLLLNRHQNNSSKANYRRRRRRNKHRDANMFVFYLGNKDASGDYIGMAISSNVLTCIYKLGGVIHEMVTSPITTTTNVNSSDFDRVIFRRVYQDAEVNVTGNFTSQNPIQHLPKRNHPNTMTGVLELDPDSVVFYVGGYPKNFTAMKAHFYQQKKKHKKQDKLDMKKNKENTNVELRYPQYRGAMKLSYINDSPVSLFNCKRAVNMDAKQRPVRIPRSEVSNYYDGTGYRMAFIREPHKMKRRLFRFNTHSRETNALLFFIGNEESSFCVFVERGFLVLQGQQAGRELRVQSADKVSLFAKSFGIIIADRFTVHCGPQQISTEHNQTNYMSFYIGGVPAQLRQRHNITAPALRGCVDHLTADTEIVEYIRTTGVSDGCPVSLLGVRSATLYSALSVDPSALWSEQTAGVSLGFRSTDRDAPLLRSSSQGSTSVHDFKLSLDDGYVVFSSDDYTLRSGDRYSDGSWHYLSAVRRPAGLELSIDNVKVIEGQSPRLGMDDQNSQGGKFKSCISNLYIQRPEQSFIPADLSSFPQTGDVVLGPCSLHQAPHSELLQDPVLRRPQKHKPSQVPTGSQCKHRRANREYQLTEEHSWLSYTVPQQDLNHRPHFSLDIKTRSSKGLILHVAGGGVVPLLALYMANGKIKMSLGQNRIILHKQHSNDGNWHRVELSVERSTFHLLVDGTRVTDGDLPNNEGSSLNLHNPVYLGGDPGSKTTKGHNIPTNSVIGCIRDFRVNDVVIGEPEESHKTLPCLDGLTEMGTYLGGGHIILENYLSVGSQFVLAFELRPQYLTGLLFHVQSHKASFNVFLMENKVGVEVNDGAEAVSVSITPPESLCDGKFHMVTVSKQLHVIELAVDSMSELRYSPFTSTSATPDTLYIGGTPKHSRVSVSSPFVGCLRNVRLDGRPVAVDTGSRVVGPVSINTCPAE